MIKVHIKNNKSETIAIISFNESLTDVEVCKRISCAYYEGLETVWIERDGNDPYIISYTQQNIDQGE